MGLSWQESLNGSADPALFRDRQPIHLIELEDGNGGTVGGDSLAGAASTTSKALGESSVYAIAKSLSFREA